MAHAVFISHSPKDQSAADEICASLEKAGIRCWMASRSVLSGSELGDAIVNMIRSSRLMVVVLSHDSNKSDQVLYELELASTSLVPILPFPIDSVMPGGRMKRYVGSSTSMDVYIYPMGYRINQLRKVVSHILKT